MVLSGRCKGVLCIRRVAACCLMSVCRIDVKRPPSRSGGGGFLARSSDGGSGSSSGRHSSGGGATPVSAVTLLQHMHVLKCMFACLLCRVAVAVWCTIQHVYSTWCSLSFP
jgi:hypothetical protein